METSRIEERIDKVAAGATEISMSLGGVQFRTMIELMEFAKLMAVSKSAVPVHLRDNPGACLAVCTKALRFGFDPFSLAEHSYAMEKNQKNEAGQWERVETIAYDSFVISAIINAHAPLIGRLDFSYSGEGDERRCKAFATPNGAAKPLEHESPTLGDLKKARGRNDKGQIKGSPLWDGPKSDQQLAYDTRRDFCRKFFPEVLMGWYDKDEYDEEIRARAATDVTPATGLKDRLRGKGGRGFNQDHVERALEHKPGEAVPEAKPEADKVPVTIKTSEAQLELTASAVETEIEEKKKAIRKADNLDDIRSMVKSATDFLKDNGRHELIADVMSVAADREKKIGKKVAA